MRGRPACVATGLSICIRNHILTLRRTQSNDTFVHEISIALNLVEALTERAETEHVAKIEAVHIQLGKLSGVVEDALQFAWELATKDTVAEGSTLVVERVPLVVFCERCESERTIRGDPILVCPECATPAPAIVRGRELQLVAMEVTDAPASH